MSIKGIFKRLLTRNIKRSSMELDDFYNCILPEYFKIRPGVELDREKLYDDYYNRRIEATVEEIDKYIISK